MVYRGASYIPQFIMNNFALNEKAEFNYEGSAAPGQCTVTIFFGNSCFKKEKQQMEACF